MPDGMISPMIEKYEKAMEENPKSRSFAPLAECYRKLGLLEKAMAIAKQGLGHHPDYVLGHICLAECYFDKGDYDEAYKTLTSLVEVNKDNIRLMKLYAQVCYEMDNYSESLECFKYLLFINPKDEKITQMVSELEEKLSDDYSVIKDTSNEAIKFKEEKISVDMDEDLDDWIQVDLNPTTPAQENSNNEDWQMSDSAESNSDKDSGDSSTLYTHSLVDLYYKQGHLEKAKDVLEKILSLNPEDEKTSARIEEINSLIANPVAADSEVTNEGRDSLMDLYDEKISKGEKTREDVLWEFHQKLVRRSKEINARS